MCRDKNDRIWQKTITKETGGLAKKDSWWLEFYLKASIWQKITQSIEFVLKKTVENPWKED